MEHYQVKWTYSYMYLEQLGTKNSTELFIKKNKLK